MIVRDFCGKKKCTWEEVKSNFVTALSNGKLDSFIDLIIQIGKEGRNMNVNALPFDALVNQAESTFGYRVLYIGENRYSLVDKDGDFVLATPTDRLRVESFLRMRLSFFADNKP